MRTYKISVARPGCPEIVVPLPPVWRNFHYLAPTRRCDHLSISDVDRDVVDVGGGAVVDEVADLEWFAGRNRRPGFVLGLCGAGQVDAGGEVGGVGEAGAVEAAVGRSVAAPEVGDAELALGVEDGGVAGVGRGCVGSEAAGRAVLGGLGDDLRDVGVVVVVVPMPTSA
jgi:hypothetical protein